MNLNILHYLEVILNDYKLHLMLLVTIYTS